MRITPRIWKEMVQYKCQEGSKIPQRSILLRREGGMKEGYAQNPPHCPRGDH